MGDGAGADGGDVRRLTVRADASEAALLERFTAHPVLRDVGQLSPDGFLEVLLQRRFLSLMFAVVYDIGIDGLHDPDAIALVREILREEYPDQTGMTPSHREDLVADLLVLGATRSRVLGSRPSDVTAGVVADTLTLMLDASAAPDDVAVLTILRFWGEVLVSVEYGVFWQRMEGVFAAAGTPSRFYHPHHHHDGREPLSEASATSATHSGRLGACLTGLLPAAGAAACFEETERQVLELRLRFYGQF